MAFNVVNIINGSTIEVGGWKWGENGSGSLISIQELLPLEQSNLSKSKLEFLLKGKNIELKNPQTIQIKDQKSYLVCSVFLEGINVMEYFPELKQTH